MKIFKQICISLLLFCVPYMSYAAEEWITDEVLKQLTEIRQELKLLRKEVQQLKSADNQPQARAKPKIIPPIKLDDADALTMGDKEAGVAIIEYSDYQCPFCKRHQKQTFPEIKKQYIDTGKVKYMTRYFPLSFHPKAKGASVAALCVAEQDADAYWKMHEKLLDLRSGDLNSESYQSLAEEMGLDKARYQACLDNADMVQKVDEQFAYGQKIGVSGTPASFIGEIKDGQLVNVKLLTGAQPFGAFKRALDSYF